jgi:hypothetical protein
MKTGLSDLSREQELALFLAVKTPAEWLIYIQCPEGCLDRSDLLACPVCGMFTRDRYRDCCACTGELFGCLTISRRLGLTLRQALLLRLERMGMFKPEPSAWIDGV